MPRVIEEVLPWLASVTCLVYILRSIKQVLLPASGIWRSPLVMFTTGALCAIVATAVALVCCFIVLTERCQPKSSSHQGTVRGGNAPKRQPWLLRRAKGLKSEGGAVNLVTTHPNAVRQGSYTGPIWLVPATLWTRGQLANQFPPPTQGPAAIARKFHATLVGSRTQNAAALLLVPEQVMHGGGSTGGSQQALAHIDQGDYWVLGLEGVTVDLLRDVLGTRSPWTKRCPLQLSHPSRPLLLGETTVYMFAESGSAKEQWYAALMATVAPHGLLATTQYLYEDYCRYMASMQIVQPPPLPPPPPPPPLMRPWPFRNRNLWHGQQHQQKEQQQQEQERHPHHQKQVQQHFDMTRAAAPGAPAAAAATKEPQPRAPPTGKNREEKIIHQPRQQQQQQQKGQHPLETPNGPSKPSAQPDPVPIPRQRGGRNPFGFILSRFGRSTSRRSDNPVTKPAAAVVAAAATPETASSIPPSHVGSQRSIHPGETIQQPLQQDLQGRVPEQQQQGLSGGNLNVDPGQLADMDHDVAGCQDCSRPRETSDRNASTGAYQPLQPSSSSPQQLPLPSQQQEELHLQGQDQVKSLQALDALIAPNHSSASPCQVVSDIFAASRPFSRSSQVAPGDAMQVPSAAAAASTAVQQGRHLAVSDGSAAVGVAVPSAEPILSAAAGGRDEAAPATSTVATRKGIVAAVVGDMSLLEQAACASHAYANAGAGMGVGAVGVLEHTPCSGHTEPSFTSWSQLQVDGTGMATSFAAGRGADAGTPTAAPAEQPRALMTPVAPSLSSTETAAMTAIAPVLKSPALDTGMCAVGVAGITGQTTSALAAVQAATAEAVTTESAGTEAVATAVSDVLDRGLPAEAAPPASSQGRQQLTHPAIGGYTRDHLENPAPSSLAVEMPGSAQETAGSSPCGLSRTGSGSSTVGPHSSHVLAGAAAVSPSWTAVPLSLPLLAQQSRHGSSMPNLLEVARRAAEGQDPGGDVSGAMRAAAGSSTANTAQPRRSLDHCLGVGGSISKGHGHGPMQGVLTQGSQQPILHDTNGHTLLLRGPSSTESLGTEANVSGALLSGGSGNVSGNVSAGVTVLAGMPKNPSKQDLKRLQREERERLKQEHQRAKAAARAAEGARKAEQQAARERARSEAQHRRQEDEANSRQAKECARALKQKVTSAKSLQDLATAVPTSVTTNPASASKGSPPFATTTVPHRSSSGDGMAIESAPILGHADSPMVGESSPETQEPGVVKNVTGDGTERGPEGVRCSGQEEFTDPSLHVPLPAPPAPPCGPNNCAPDGSTWPQLALDLVWVGNATATVSTKIDFDRAASDHVDQPAASGSASEPVAMMPTAPGLTADTISGTSSGEAAALKAKSDAPVWPPLPVHAEGLGLSSCSAVGEVAGFATPAADTSEAAPGNKYESLPSLGNHPSAIVVQADLAIGTSLPAGTHSRAASRGSNTDGGEGPGLLPIPPVQPPPASAIEPQIPVVPSGAEQLPDEAGTASGAGRAGRVAGKGGGGGFWMNFVPFFALLRKAGQALASNLAGSLSGTPVEVHLQARRFECTLLLWLAPPPSDRLWLSFAEPPKMDFTVTPVLGNRKLSGGLVVGRLSAWVRSKVNAGLSRAMVYPACVDVRMGNLLLSIDSPGDAMRPFMPPRIPSPPQTFAPISLQPSGLPASPSRDQLPQNGNMPVLSELGGTDRQPPSGAGTRAQPSFRPPGCPPWPPPVPTSRGNSQIGLWPGEASREVTGALPLQTPPHASSATGLCSVGSSSSLLENTLNHVFRSTQSIWDSTPGTLSPMEGMSDAGEDEEEVEGEVRNGEGDVERRQQAERNLEEKIMFNSRRLGTDHADGCDAGHARKLRASRTGNMEDCSVDWSLPYGDGWAGWAPAAGGMRVGGVSATGSDPCGRDMGRLSRAGSVNEVIDGKPQHIQYRRPCDTLASASSSSLAGQQLQPPQAHQGQVGKRKSGGPFHWIRGAAGLVARGVGGVGNAGIRGLSAAGSALGQAMLRPVVNAGERAVVQQQLQATRAPVGPSVAPWGQTQGNMF
ncbi:hypothetical protein Vretimale_3331 [Volvox reticuliferus]|uniref:SMP-LTD domain-containing protein n=1 Tax=Volvox reticuliferus TaxID=1737510 RepID=A0A8J4D9N7_9CHLO|nr:hypothetical protein Vretimale_3331 [Volvox reticuliferus]